MYTYNERQTDVEASRTTSIGREVESQTLSPGVCPGDELAAALKPVACRGVTISRGPTAELVGGITVDLAIAGSRGTFGVICDALDTGRLQRQPWILAGLEMNRVYCLSAFDALTDPDGVAAALSRMEPGYLRTPAPSGSRSRVHVTRVALPDPSAFPWDGEVTHFGAVGRAARAA